MILKFLLLRHPYLPLPYYGTDFKDTEILTNKAHFCGTAQETAQICSVLFSRHPSASFIKKCMYSAHCINHAALASSLLYSLPNGIAAGKVSDPKYREFGES
jgi:hypothetical protein